MLSLSRRFSTTRISALRSLTAVVLVAASVILPIQLTGSSPASADPASGTIEGNVFRDFGMDGVFDDVDAAEPDIEVRVFDDENAMAGPVTSGEDGSYSVDLASLTQTSNDTYRVEFTIPSSHSHLQSSFLGDDNDGPVQFVAAGSSDADYAVTNPAQFCEANPSLALTCWVNGQADGDTDDGANDSDSLDALITLPWDGHSSSLAGGDLTLPTDPSHIAYNGDIGTTWGVAHQRSTDSLYVGAAQRRHAGFGPGGTGMIYKASTDGSSVGSFLDLNALGISTGADPHSGLPDQSWVQSNPAASASYDAASFDAVGKISLGDIDISEDGETLWAVNVNNRTLLEIPIGPTGTAPSAAEITQHDLGSAVTCTNGQFRPFGLGVRDGKVYAGGVCSGEDGGDAGDVVSHVLTHDPNGADSNFTSVYTLPMNYRSTLRPTDEECAFRLNFSDGSLFGAIGCDGWGPWGSSWDDVNPEELILSPDHRFYAAPQPMLTDIELDADGSIVLAFADRFGLQSGFRNYDDSGTNTDLHSGTTGGDLIRICNETGTLTFPCRDDDSEFYVGDNAPGGADLHPESSWGAIAMHFGNGEVAMTIADPINVWSGGVGWFDKTTGLISTNSPANTLRRYEVFTGGSDNLSAPPSGQTGVGKAAGLGDIELVCDVAPFQIGNRVWFDKDANGRQDPSEPALPNVTVNLLANDGTFITSTTTDDSGTYTFSSLDITELATLTDYRIEFDPSTADLSEIDDIADVSLLTATTQNSAAADDNDDSDIDPATNQVDITTGTSGASTFSFDAGFTGGLQLGNMVWFDYNDNGDAEEGEPLVTGVTLQLFREDGAPGFDGTEEIVETTTTDENGIYLFRQIIEGETYYIGMPTDQSASPITVDGQTLDPATLMAPSGPATIGPDNVHDGTPYPGFIAITEPITPSDAAGSEPEGEINALPAPGSDAEAQAFELTGHAIDDDDSDLTRDFGLVQKMRIGNLIWLDGEYGDAGFNNGIADPDESDLGLGAVEVELYTDNDADGVFDPDDGDTLVDSTTTDEEGRYWFDALSENDYFVAIPEGQTGQLLNGESVDLNELNRSSPAASDSNNGADDVNDGSATTDFSSVSNRFAAIPNTAPTNESGDFDEATAEAEANAEVGDYIDSFSNLTIDFSFVEQPVFSIGNLVWADLDDDGEAEDGEPGIEGVTVNLHLSGETDVYDTTETDDEGKYVFVDIPAGDYDVSVDADQQGQRIDGQDIDLSTLVASSTVTSDASDDADNDNNGVGSALLVASTVSVGDPNPFAPTEPTDETLRADDDTDDDTTSEDSASNLTVDFGFVIPARIGNLVWIDNGGGEAGDETYDPADEDDGEADETESGVEGVLVRLLDEDNNVIYETVTDGLGRYWVPGVVAADYRVGIPSDQVPILDLTLAPDSEALNGLKVSSVSSTDPEADDDVNDGISSIAYLALSPVVSIDYGAEPTDENGDFGDATDNAAETAANDANGWLPDESSNLAIDFGFAPIPTYSVGDLLWEDYDNDGIADVDEPGIAGVLVQLIDDEGVIVAELLTDEAGNYRFDEVLAGEYTIRIPSNQEPEVDLSLTPTEGALDGLKLSSTSVADPDDAASVDHDSNGVANPQGAESGVFELGNGDTHEEPEGESVRSDDPTSVEPGNQRADRTELTVDFGFWRGLRLGNQVWLDGVQGEAGYDNGIMDEGELGLVGVTVQLWLDADDDGVAEPGGDDIGSMVATTQTDSEGNYWFTGLEDGQAYFVVIDNPDGLQENQEYSSTGSSADPTATDNDDDGAPKDTRAAVSNVVTMSTASHSTGETDAVPAEDAEAEANTAEEAVTPDANSELHVDFGFIEVPVFRLGNLVWDDANANGKAELDEAGIAGVLVQLVDDGTVIGETVTGADGTYVFENLVAGEYTVTIPTSQIPTLAEQPELVATALDGFRSSTTNESSDPDDDVDNDENGLGSDLVVGTEGEDASSGIVTLGPDTDAPSFETEPTNETARHNSGDDVDPDLGEANAYPDSMSNLSVDFGFYRLTLGNQVWFDTNADGTKDEGEPGINGVAVSLIHIDDEGEETVVETILTTNDGQDGMFVFAGLVHGEKYLVEIADDQFDAGAPLGGMYSSPDTDPVNDVTDGADNDDNGIDPESGEPLRTEPVMAMAAAAPTGENPAGTNPAADETQNVTVDLGVVGLAVGDTVWLDDNGNGVLDEDESGIADAIVELWAADAEGNPTGEEPIASKPTEADGTFMFDGLVPGSFVLVLPAENFEPEAALEGLTSTIGNGVVAPATGDDVDADDNGNLDETGLFVATGLIELDYASEPTDETGGDPAGFAPANTNLAVDFGLVPTPPMSIGNRVWDDLNNNGSMDEGEPGVEGVAVELWAVDADGNVTGTEPVSSVETNEEGYYLFEDVAPGMFVVVLPESNFAVDGPAHGMFSSTASAAVDPDDDSNDDDNGVDPTEVRGDVVSLPVTLVPSWEPLNEPDTGPGAGQVGDELIHDSNSNLTVDFGLVTVGLGDAVWFDADNSGTFDKGESLFADVELALVDADGNVVDTTTTDEEGNYLFAGFAPGDYRVVVIGENFEEGGPLHGYYSSTGNGVAPDPDDDGNFDDNGDPVGGEDSEVGGVSTELVTIAAGSEPTDETADAGVHDANINSTVDFGFYTSELTTDLWIDANGNGQFDKGEEPLDEVKVELIENQVPENVLDVSASNREGLLAFIGLPEGNVQLHFPADNFDDDAPLDGLVLRSANLNTDGSMTSGPIKVVAGLNDVDLLDILGSTLVPESTIGDTVWDDQNRDGKQDPGEPGLPGVVLTLLDADGSEVATATTDENGVYRFDNLPPSEYTVQVTVPEGWEISPPNAGDDDDTDSDVDVATRSTTFVLDTGDTPSNIDIGLHQPASANGSSDGSADAATDAAADADADADPIGTPPNKLAFTGSTVVRFTLAAVLLLGIGVTLVAIRRKKLVL